VTKTFSDTVSGARDDRPGLAALMDYVREGDTVVVWKLDRLGRNTLHILHTVTPSPRRPGHSSPRRPNVVVVPNHQEAWPYRTGCGRLLYP
jgi:Resolvase, N terminal domain